MFARKPVQMGAVTVTTAGTRVRLTAGQSDPTADILTPWIYLQAAEANTGVIYVGLSTVASTAYIAALGAGEAIQISAGQVRGSQGEYSLNDFYVDSSVNGEKVYVTYDKARG